METLTIKLYERLKEKLGSEDTSLLIEFIEEKVKGEVATKEDILKLDKRISEEIARLDKRITDEVAKLDKRITDEVAKLDKRISDLEWKMKLYFILIAVLIIITNQKALELIGRVLGIIK